MNKYEKDIYEFYIKPDNFRTALEIIEYFPTVKRQLLIEFWDLVEVKVQEGIKAKLPNWKSEKTKDIFKEWSQISIWNSEWDMEHENGSPLGISYESLTGRLIVGVWIDKENKVWDVEKIRLGLRQLQIQKQFTAHSDWWPFYKFTGYNLEERQNIELILPDNRERLAEELSNSIIELAENVNKSIDIRRLLNENLL